MIHDRASATFLWVSLVFQELDRKNSKLKWVVNGPKALSIVGKIPSGLSELYNRMMARIEKEQEDEQKHCKAVLVATLLAFRPVSLSELSVLVGLQPENDPETVVNNCGSFLTINDETVSLVHKSAQDYLLENYPRLQPAGAAHGVSQGHADIGRRSIDAMSSRLKQNMYNLPFGFKPKDMKPPDCNRDALAPIRYSCVFWVDHLCFQNGESPEGKRVLADNGEVFAFLKHRFLRWLESLSLLGMLSDGTLLINKLLHTVQVCR